jgi:hypothetical protein
MKPCSQHPKPDGISEQAQGGEIVIWNVRQTIQEGACEE